jgi:hypothetical protein
MNEGDDMDMPVVNLSKRRELTDFYVSTAIFNSLAMAVFLGYLCLPFQHPLVGVSYMGPNWFSWSASFAVVFWVLSFAPRRESLYRLNALLILAFSLSIYFIGTIFSPHVNQHLGWFILFCLVTMGGPLWLLVILWLLHAASCVAPFRESQRNEITPSLHSEGNGR